MNSYPTGSYRWMRDVLEVLFADLDVQGAMQLLRDKERRAMLVDSIPRVGSLRRAHPDVGDDEFNNLLVALLVLRTKFTRSEAIEKVETNIAMREGRM